MRNKSMAALFAATILAMILITPGCSTKKLSPTGVYGSGSVVGTIPSVTYATNVVSVTNAAGIVSPMFVVVTTTNNAVLVDGLILYGIDNTIGQSYADLDAFVSWEANNRATLVQWPAIKQAADYIRVNAKGWVKAAISARETYKANPTAQTQSLLDTAIKVLSDAFANAKALAAAQTAVPVPAAIK